MESPKRKPTRLKGYDYSSPGMYFLTICVKDRKQLLGKIVGGGDFDAPQMMLSKYGQILDKYIKLINEKYSHIGIDKYVCKCQVKMYNFGELKCTISAEVMDSL